LKLDEDGMEVLEDQDDEDEEEEGESD